MAQEIKDCIYCTHFCSSEDHRLNHFWECDKLGEIIEYEEFDPYELTERVFPRCPLWNGKPPLNTIENALAVLNARKDNLANRAKGWVRKGDLLPSQMREYNALIGELDSVERVIRMLHDTRDLETQLATNYAQAKA